jgi:NTE family protein
MARMVRSDTLEAALARVFETASGGASWFTLPGGVRLYAAGDPADTLFLLRSGRLGVFKHDEGQEPHYLGVIKPGEPVGEMSLIAGTPHASTVVALRDSEIVALPREAFLQAAYAHPEVMAELARLMILRARQTTVGVAEPTVFGFIGRSARAILPWVELLEAEIAGQGHTVKIVTSQALKSATEWFSAIEESHDYVLYVAERAEVAWSHLCARQCDRLFLVGRAGEEPPTDRPWQGGDAFENHQPVDLILIERPSGDRPEHTAAWIDAVSPVRWFHVKGGDRRDAARIARVLTGTSVGLVLSGGGARAYSHVGAIRAMRDAGVPFDFLGGASMGGIVAAAVAMGWDQEEMDARLRKAFVESSPVGDMAIPLMAMSGGKRVDERLEEHFGDVQIEDLRLPFFCVSSNITSGGFVVHRRGLLRRALRASIAIPGVLPPVVEAGAVLVDGAVIHNFPVDLMRAWHLGPVVGVDVSRTRGVEPKALENPASWWKWFLSGAWRQGPPIVSIMIRSATLTNKAEIMQARNAADLLILPDPEGVEIRDWKAYEPAVLAGWKAATEAMARLDGPITQLRRRKLDAEKAVTERVLAVEPRPQKPPTRARSLLRRTADGARRPARGRRAASPAAPAPQPGPEEDA